MEHVGNADRQWLYRTSAHCTICAWLSVTSNWEDSPNLRPREYTAQTFTAPFQYQIVMPGDDLADERDPLLGVAHPLPQFARE